MGESKKPQCLGFIMDGNRRWATEQNLVTLEGHQKGLEVFLDVVRFIRDEEIPHAVFYAFSTENWKRSEEEVGYLMQLFKGLLVRLQEELKEKQVRVRIIGSKESFSPDLQTQMRELEEKSEAYTDTTIWIALSYGGRAEIVAAVNKAIEKGQSVTEDTFKQLLWTADMPDPDMIIRTSGEERLSNFLLWSAAYSEFYFIKKHWPALTKADFNDMLLQYAKRKRRKGA
jgi:undecaprenyl diphosphate synthase